MKKHISALLSFLILSASLSGCFIEKGGSAEKPDESPDEFSAASEPIFEVDSTPTPIILEKFGKPAACTLSDKKIEQIVKNTEDVIALNPDFSGTILLSAGDRIIYEKSFGTTGVKNEDNSNDTKYQIGSVTKQFTGTAIMQLIAEGKVSTSDKISKYFPEYEYDFMDVITVEHLLEMTAGMGDYMQLIEGDETKVAEYVKAAEKSEEDAKKYIVDTIFADGIGTDPGKVYTYSNSAYYLLGLIIEQQSGMSYRDYLQKNFFDRADMKDTYFVGDGKDLSTGYSPAQEKYVSDKDSKELAAEGDYPYLFSAGSVVSTVEDVNKWLSVVTSDELFSNSDRKTIEKSVMCYNYGWNTSDNIWHHSGRTYAYSSQVYADYHTDTKMVILTNIAFYSDLNDISLKIYLPLKNAVK